MYVYTISEIWKGQSTNNGNGLKDATMKILCEKLKFEKKSKGQILNNLN